MIRVEGEDFSIGDAPRVLTHAQASNDATASPYVYLLRRAQPASVKLSDKQCAHVIAVACTPTGLPDACFDKKFEADWRGSRTHTPNPVRLPDGAPHRMSIFPTKSAHRRPSLTSFSAKEQHLLEASAPVSRRDPRPTPCRSLARVIDAPLGEVIIGQCFQVQAGINTPGAPTGARWPP